MLYKTEGIIIKNSNLGEFDRLITVYTKEFGKLAVKGKSVRKNQAKLKGHLELFLLSDLMIAPGKGFDIITSAETIKSFPYLHQNLNHLLASHYFSELIDKLIAGPEKDDNLWQLIVSSFEQLNQKESDIKIIASNFEDKLLQILGYGQQENFIDFVQGLINSRINSYQHLIKVL